MRTIGHRTIGQSDNWTFESRKMFFDCTFVKKTPPMKRCIMPFWQCSFPLG